MSVWDDLASGLARLEAIVGRAVDRATDVLGAPGADPYRGLVLGPDDVTRWRDRPPGATWADDDDLASSGHGPRLDALGDQFGLDRLDLDLVLVALGPEVDLKYERLYAYLQDDVGQRRPTVELALSLLCDGPAGRLTARARLGTDGALVRQGLIHLDDPPGRAGCGFLGRVLCLDPQFVDAVLGQGGLDPRLVGFCRLERPRGGRGIAGGQPARIASLIREASRTGAPPLIHFQGPPGRGQRLAAETIAEELGVAILSIDLGRLDGGGRDSRGDLPTVAVREGTFQGALLFIDGLGRLGEVGLDGWMQAIERGRAPVIISGPEDWALPPSARSARGILTLPFPRPSAALLRSLWAGAAESLGRSIEPDVVEALADRFRLDVGRIEDAVRSAELSERFETADSAHPQADGEPRTSLGRAALFEAARLRGGQALATLARKVEPRARREDLILPADSLAQLDELCGRAAARGRVLDAWGFGAKLARGKGVSALFAGPSGTGKTMAAEVIAGELGLDLCAIDLAGVVSKYIGETEKNLDAIFRAADDANAVLFFDEADALFGKRSEVRDAHDRYANIEISYLLQKIEHFEGVAILATNLRQNMDDAFTRRLAFCIPFPFPDAADRRRIWASVWPAEAPLAADADLDALAARFPLSGGHIKNMALAAAYLAARDGTAVTMAHLLQAARREFQKMGKVLSDHELEGRPAPEDWS